MKILVIPNLDKQGSVACANKTVEQLAELSAEPMLDAKYRQYIERQELCIFGETEHLEQECDILLAIGGDGTILNTVTQSIQVNKPVIGINTGRVGFLTQLEDCELGKLSLLVEGNYRIEERMMLEMQVEPGGEQLLVLNDVIISRGNNKILELGVYWGNDLVVKHRADGIIFSTPTGSTGYSLSAGGAVVDPSLSAILLTAICPYSSFNRSLLLPPDKVYTVLMEDNGEMGILADGEVVDQLTMGRMVQIRQSRKKAKLIDLGIRDFYSNFREKLILRR